MSHRRFSNSDMVRILQEIETHRKNGIRLHTACRKAGVTDTTYYKWRNESKNGKQGSLT
ncbi:MAG: transposase [Pseudomonadota bacterium]